MLYLPLLTPQIMGGCVSWLTAHVGLPQHSPGALSSSHPTGRLLYVGQLKIYQKYKLKRCSKKECCKQCRMYAKFKGTMTKWPVQKPTHRTTQKHVEHQDATNI